MTIREGIESTPDGGIVVDVEYVHWLQAQRARINKTPLEKIRLRENGELVEPTAGSVERFNFTGLSNIDFILTDFYKDYEENKPLPGNVR